MQRQGQKAPEEIMDTQNILMQLLARFRNQQPQPGLLGSGMASSAAQALQSRPYQMHVKEYQAQGQEPLPYEEWVKQYQQQGGRL